jgi:hypothetical protein
LLLLKLGLLLMSAARKQKMGHGARIALPQTAIRILGTHQQAAMQQVFAKWDAALIHRKDYAWKILLKKYVRWEQELGLMMKNAILPMFLNAD